MKKYILIAVVLLVSVGMMGMACVGGVGDVAITVTGTGSVRVQPDFAMINFNVESKHMNMKQAQEQNAQTMNNLVEILAEWGVEKTDITTNFFNVYPDYHYGMDRQLMGYVVNNQLGVKVRDIENVGKVIDAAANLVGTVHVNGVTFGVEDNSAAYNEALVKAIYSAKEKASVLTRVANLSELRIVSIKENHSPYFGFERYGLAEGAGTSVLNNGVEVSATVEVIFAH